MKINATPVLVVFIKLLLFPPATSFLEQDYLLNVSASSKEGSLDAEGSGNGVEPWVDDSDKQTTNASPNVPNMHSTSSPLRENSTYKLSTVQKIFAEVNGNKSARSKGNKDASSHRFQSYTDPKQFTGKSTWAGANQLCSASYNVTLPNIHSRDDLVRTVEYMKSKGWDRMWLGHRRVAVTHPHWLDQSAPGPHVDKAEEGTFQCGVLNARTRRVQYLQCNQRPHLLGYLCQLPATNPAEKCNCFDAMHNGPCFTTSSGYCFLELCCNQTWFEARHRCHQLGGDLAVVKDNATIQAILTKHHIIKYWVGISNVQWMPGFNWSYTGVMWLPEEPLPGRHCVIVTRDGTRYGIRSASCLDNHNFSCFLDNQPAAKKYARPSFSLAIMMMVFLLFILMGLVVGINCKALQRWWKNAGNPSLNRFSKQNLTKNRASPAQRISVEKPLLSNTEKDSSNCLDMEGTDEPRELNNTLMSPKRKFSDMIFPTYVCSCKEVNRDLIFVPRIHGQWFGQKPGTGKEVVLQVYLVDLNCCSDSYLQNMQPSTSKELLSIGKPLQAGGLGQLSPNDHVALSFSNKCDGWKETSKTPVRTLIGSVVCCHTRGVVPLAAEFVFETQDEVDVFQGYLNVTIERSSSKTNEPPDGKANQLEFSTFFRIDFKGPTRSHSIQDPAVYRCEVEKYKFPPSVRFASLRDKAKSILPTGQPSKQQIKRVEVPSKTSAKYLERDEREKSPTPSVDAATPSKPKPKSQSRVDQIKNEYYAQIKPSLSKTNKQKPTETKSAENGEENEHLLHQSGQNKALTEEEIWQSIVKLGNPPVSSLTSNPSQRASCASLDTFNSDSYMNLEPPPDKVKEEPPATGPESPVDLVVSSITDQQFDILWEKGLKMNQLDLMDFIIEYCDDQKKAHRSALEHWITTSGSLNKLLRVLESSKVGLPEVAAEIRKTFPESC